MNSLQRILDTIKKADSEELDRVHADIVERNQKASPDERIVSTDFEVDGKIHKVPFRALREYLQTGKATGDSQPAQEVFRGRIPRSVGDIVDSERTSQRDSEGRKQNDNDGSYYWDKNYNYEYMNPEAEKQRVLGKIRK
jgi:hypothetical protein